MSVLTNKNILVVGDQNSQIQDLEKALHGYGVITHSLSCEIVSIEKIQELKIDLVVLINLDNDQEGKTCRDVLNILRTSDLGTIIPIFILVEENNKKIHEALTLGAADYLTPQEDTESVVLKMKTIFGQGNDFVSSSNIDITPMVTSATTAGIKVYVVEDDPLLRNLLAIKLNESSFPSEFSADGKGVMAAIQQFKPNVIILDLMLPGKSGFEILADIKEDDELKDIPVVVFSNRDGQDDRRKAKELGAAGFYVKAMTDLSELIETIQSLAK